MSDSQLSAVVSIAHGVIFVTLVLLGVFVAWWLILVALGIFVGYFGWTVWFVARPLPRDTRSA